jgi:hypothetical protein
MSMSLRAKLRSSSMPLEVLEHLLALAGEGSMAYDNEQ